MPFLLLGILILLVLLLLGRALAKADPAKAGPLLGWFLAGLAVVGIGTGIVLLVISDRLGLALSWAAVAAPLLLRGRTLWRRRQSTKAPTGGQTSEVETDFLCMQLDHDTGSMDGIVRRGVFAGRGLADLTAKELVALWHQCRAEDEPSARLLESYLDRRMPNWRKAEEAASAPSDTMTRAEASAILGLPDDADAGRVKDAHRRLMLKLHPDQGGSTYLAAKINRAKEVLLAD